MLELMGKGINTFYLIDHQISLDDGEFRSKEVSDELASSIQTKIFHPQLLLMTHNNMHMIQCYKRFSSPKVLHYLLMGLVGQKKYSSSQLLYKALLATIISRQLVALATAPFSVAISILPGSQTIHSRFKISLNLNKNNTYNVNKQSLLEKLLWLAKLIIWDEAPMLRRQSVEAFDRMLQDINDYEVLLGRKVIVFGGKIVVFGENFRQVLLVMHKVTREQ